MIDLDRQIAWPEVRAGLVLGLGGGSDAIAAFALAQLLDPTLAYGNTKHALDDDMLHISPRIGRLPDAAPVRGHTKIERRLPRGPHGSPLVVAEGNTLRDELAALGFAHIIGVDTGGDALDTRGGRDRRMLDVIAPALLVVVAPGADGQLATSALEAAIDAAADRYLGAFSLAPLLPALREHGRELGDTRTPNIICRAFDVTEDPVTIPRGCRPQIPRRWLMTGLVFSVPSASR